MVEWLMIGSIYARNDVQVRKFGINEDTVETYTNSLLADNEYDFEPITVIQLESGAKIIADGFHRYEAYKRAKRDTIPAIVETGTLADAKTISENANMMHGKALSNQDKYNMFERRFYDGRVWFEIGENGERKQLVSNVMISRDLGISEGTIRNWLANIITSQNYEVNRSEVRGVDGRTYDYSKKDDTPEVMGQNMGRVVVDDTDYYVPLNDKWGIQKDEQGIPRVRDGFELYGARTGQDGYNYASIRKLPNIRKLPDADAPQYEPTMTPEESQHIASIISDPVTEKAQPVSENDSWQKFKAQAEQARQRLTVHQLTLDEYLASIRLERERQKLEAIRDAAQARLDELE